MADPGQGKATAPNRHDQSAAAVQSMVLDYVSVSIEREPRAAGQNMMEREGLWVGHMRRIGAQKLRAWGLTPLVESVELLISELVTNAFKHGTGHTVTFRLIIGQDVILVEVDDDSAGRPEIRLAGPDDENGRGLQLVSAIATNWGADGTRIWCSLTTTTAARAR